MQQVQLSEKITETQKINLALEEQLTNQSAHVISSLVGAETSAMKLDTTLRETNFLLDRVERTVHGLSIILEALTVPSQIMSHAHFKFLSLFTAATGLLYLWLPRKYAYSMVAMYGKCLSTILQRYLSVNSF